MAMTLKELAVNVLDYLNVTSTDAAIGNGSADLYAKAWQWINWAMQDFADIGPWPWLKKDFESLTVAAAAYEIDLPDTFRQMLTNPSYEDSQYGVLKAVTTDEIQALRAFSTTSGIPQYWALGFNDTAGSERDTLVVHPPASAEVVLKITYAKELTEMAAAITKLPVPDRYGRIVQTGAIAYAEEMNQRNWSGGARPEFERQAREAFRKWGRQQTFVARSLRKHNHRRDSTALRHMPERGLEISYPS